MPAYLLEPAAAAATVPDYSSAITNITSELNDIDTDTTSMAAQILLIAASLSTMATNSTTIAQKLTAIETYQKTLKELGETTGIRTRNPYEAFGMVTMYKLLIEEAKVLELEKVPSEKIDQAWKTVLYYIEKINNAKLKDF